LGLMRFTRSSELPSASSTSMWVVPTWMSAKTLLSSGVVSCVFGSVWDEFSDSEVEVAVDEESDEQPANMTDPAAIELSSARRAIRLVSVDSVFSLMTFCFANTEKCTVRGVINPEQEDCDRDEPQQRHYGEVEDVGHRRQIDRHLFDFA